jgi:hypothetical protein
MERLSLASFGLERLEVGQVRSVGDLAGEPLLAVEVDARGIRSIRREGKAAKEGRKEGRPKGVSKGRGRRWLNDQDEGEGTSWFV